MKVPAVSPARVRVEIRKAMDGAIAGLRGFLSCLTGAEEKGILCGCGAWNKGDVLNLTQYTAGRHLHLHRRLQHMMKEIEHG